MGMSQGVGDVLRTMLESNDVVEAIRKSIIDRTLDPELELLLWEIAYSEEPPRQPSIVINGPRESKPKPKATLHALSSLHSVGEGQTRNAE